jgi:hypothetical protein
MNNAPRHNPLGITATSQPAGFQSAYSPKGWGIEPVVILDAHKALKKLEQIWFTHITPTSIPTLTNTSAIFSAATTL